MSELVLYTSNDGRTRMHLRIDGGTIWLTQAEIGELFQTSKQNVSLHAKNILEEGELRAEATLKDSLTVQKEGNRDVKRSITHHNLDLILAIGYRVRSPRGTQFRQWATTHLREYLVKGFVMDDQRLADPGGFDYFDELLDRIRDIRASEKRFYQKVRDLFALSKRLRIITGLHPPQDTLPLGGSRGTSGEGSLLYAVPTRTLPSLTLDPPRGRVMTRRVHDRHQTIV